MSILDFNLDLDSLELDNIGSWPLWIRQVSIGLVCICILGVAYYYDFNIQWELYKDIEAKRYKQQEAFAEKQTQVKHLDVYTEQLHSIRETFAILKRELPKEKEEALFLETISQQASISGLTFLSIKPLSEENKEFYMAYPLELKLKGTYHGMGTFISHMAGMPRMVTSHDFSIKAVKPEKALFETVEITLLLKIYSTEKFK